MATQVAIVTVTYNSSSVLPGFLHSLKNQKHASFKLYAIDNASSDGSADVLDRESDSRLIVIKNQNNVGFSEGSNQGIARAIADGFNLVLLLNNDTEFPDNFLEILVKAAQTHEHDLFAPKIYFYDDPTRIWYAGGRFSRWLARTPSHIGEGQTDGERFSHEREIDFITGCAMLIKAEVFQEIGLLDGQYFAYLEDGDFCWRARCAGFSMLYVPAAHLYHKVSSLTGGALSPFSIRMGVRNRVYFFRKHFGRIGFLTLSNLYLCFIVTKWVISSENTQHLRIRLSAFREGLKMRADKQATPSVNRGS